MLSTDHFPRAKKYWHMGAMRDWSDLILHPMAHALHYGTSVFEGIRAYETSRGPAIFRLEEHIDRFFISARVARMNVPYGKEEILGACKRTLRENGLEAGYLRPLLYYSYGNLGLIPKVSPVELVVGAWKWGAYMGEKAETGITVIILPWRRVHHSQVDLRAKLGGIYIQSAICGLEARARGAEEALFLNLEGRVAEGPGENIFLVRDGVLKTNDLSESILEGITRASLLEIARDLGLEAVIGPIAKDELYAADEAFFCGTAVEVTPILRVIDGSDAASNPAVHSIGPGRAGEVTIRLRQAFREVTAGRNPRFERWLTFV
jgi:branched-chain amino acid aminotransferase